MPIITDKLLNKTEKYIIANLIRVPYCPYPCYPQVLLLNSGFVALHSMYKWQFKQTFTILNSKHHLKHKSSTESLHFVSP
jgi:hypothetical protein